MSNITRFYIWRCLSGLSLVYALRVIYLMSKGVTPAELALLASVLAVSGIALEIPTGFIADRWSRKLSVSLGFLCKSLAVVGMIFVDGFYGLLPLAVLGGLSDALLSGAEESLLFDELKHVSKQEEFLRTSSRGTSFATISGAVGTFVGPLLYVVIDWLPFVLTSVVWLTLGLFVLTFDETKVAQETKRNIKMWDGIREIFKVRALLVIVAINGLLLVFVQMFYQVLYFPKINGLGFPIQYLGVLDAGNLLLMTVMLWGLPKLAFKRDKVALAFYSLLAGTMFVLFSTANVFVWAVGFGVLFDLAWAARMHVVPSITHRYLGSGSRALAISSMSLVSKLGAAVLLPVMTYAVGFSYWYTLLVLILVGGLLMLYPSRSG